MPWHSKIKIYSEIFRRVPNRYHFVAGVLLVMAVYLVAFREQTIAYSYSGETCDQRLVLLPEVFSQVGSDRYKITSHGGWSIAGYQVTATSLCVSPAEAPVENSLETLAYAPWASWLMRLTYHVEAGAPPSVDASALRAPIPVSRDLLLPLSGPDATFSYTFEVDGEEASCEPTIDDLICAVPILKLKQGSKYTAKLEKHFKSQKLGDVVEADIETLSPLSVTNSSIENNGTVYDKPKSITLSVDKPIEEAELEVWRVDGEEPTRLEAKTTFEGQKVSVAFAKDLPREATITLKVASLEALDGSTPLDEQLLKFQTSGGPRVIGVNVGSTGVVAGTQIVVTFDQKISADQDVGSLVVLSKGITFQSAQGSQLIFSTDKVGRCNEMSITLQPKIESPYGIAGQSAWQYKGRTRCYTVSTIGHSVQGRPIHAYHFGDGGSNIVYTGAIHGNEVSTKLLMDRWIQELDANPGKIPRGKRIVVVPTINPDGFATGKRVNAHNVDLNRNFATGDWQKNIEHVDGSSFPGGGGKKSMSEPETKALVAFIAQLHPELVLSYHSIGGMVISNQAGQAGSRASQYAQLSGYRLSSGGGGEFGYQITGTADDYYREKLGVPSVLIELGSHSYHQFERNREAMWAMMR